MRQAPVPLCEVYKSTSWHMHLDLKVGQPPTGTFGEEELAGQVYLGDHQVCKQDSIEGPMMHGMRLSRSCPSPPSGAAP